MNLHRDGLILATNESLVVEFLNEMNAQTISTANFRLSNAAGNLMIAEISYNNNIAIFTPQPQFEGYSKCLVKVDASVSDISGNSIGAENEWEFKAKNRPT
jgi:hypothetical protein